MDDKLDFSVVEMTEENMISIDESTGMPIIGNVATQSHKDVKKDDAAKDEPTEELIEVADDPTKKDTPLNKEPENPSSDSVFAVLIEALNDKGVVSSKINIDEVKKAIDEGEEPTNILFEILEHELKTQVEFYKEQLPEKIKTLIDRYEEGVPFEDLLKIKTEQQRLDNIPESKIREDVNLQKEIVKRYMTERGETETRIAKQLKRLEELDELEDEAIDSHNALIGMYKEKEVSLKEKTIEAEKTKEKERVAFLENLKVNINNTKEIVPNIMLSEKEKQAIITSMTKPVGVDEHGNPISSVLKTRSINPVEFEKALHYYHHIGLFNFDKDGKFNPDFSKLSTDIKNKTVDKLSKILSGEDVQGSGSVSRTKTSVKAEDNIDKISRFLKQS